MTDQKYNDADIEMMARNLEGRFTCPGGVDLLRMSKAVSPDTFRLYTSWCRNRRAEKRAAASKR